MLLRAGRWPERRALPRRGAALNRCLSRCLAGGGVWGQAEFCQPRLQEPHSAGDGVGPAGGGLQVHDALVEIFVVGVVAQCGLQGGECLAGAGRFKDLGDAGPGVQGPAAGGLTAPPGPNPSAICP
jgi:hypothetical protein